jgi:hypothetical protein
LTLAREVPETTPAGTVLVLHRKVPEKLPAAPIFVIDPENSCDLWELGDRLDNPIVTRQDKDSLLMTHVRLDNVLMPQARKLTFPGHAHVLASAVTGEALYALFERPEGKVLVLTVNLAQGDLPLRTAFPILMTNALGWFAGSAGELRESLASGATTEVTWAAPAKAPAPQLWSPAGEPRPLPPDRNKATIGPLDRCGVWRIAAATGEAQSPRPAEPLLEIACNLASKGESDLRPAEGLPSTTALLPVAAGFLTRPLWYYLIAVAWLLAALEWVLYQRRWIS